MRRELITTKSVFAISLIVSVSTILLVYGSGIQDNRSLFVNSLTSVTILSLLFFTFITLGLYNNFKLKDDIGKVLTKENIAKMPRHNGIDLVDFNMADLGFDGEGCGSVILGILAWIAVAFIAIVLIFSFGWIVWGAILGLVAMLYWIFFRALRLVFKMAPVCNGNLIKSAGYGLFYTFLYNSWIYTIIFISHYLSK